VVLDHPQLAPPNCHWVFHASNDSNNPMRFTAITLHASSDITETCELHTALSWYYESTTGMPRYSRKLLFEQFWPEIRQAQAAPLRMQAWRLAEGSTAMNTRLAQV
jgi:hypothetical protein